MYIAEFINKYSGHWFLKTDEERIKWAINSVRNTFVIKNEEYSKGFIDACKAIEANFNALKSEKKDV